MKIIDIINMFVFFVFVQQMQTLFIRLELDQLPKLNKLVLIYQRITEGLAVQLIMLTNLEQINPVLDQSTQGNLLPQALMYL